MRRFFINSSDVADFILTSLGIIKMGEILIPKMESFNIKTLADEISKSHKIIGLRQ